MNNKILSLLKIVIPLILCILVVTNFKSAEVSGSSMFPTFEDGDFLIVSKNVTKVKPLDTIVIYNEALDKYLCKRVIGLEGDHIVIDNGKLYINDKLQKEDYIRAQDWGFNMSVDVTIDKDEIYVMGDNRNNSLDSRELGVMFLDDLDGIILLDITKKYHLTKDRLRIVLIVCWIFVIAITMVSFRSQRNDSYMN